MPRNLDATLAAHLGDPVIGPAIFAELSFKSGKERVWSGVGDFVGPEGNTFQGVGNFGGIGAIGEGTEVKAEGTTVTLSGIGDSLFDIPPSPVTPPDPPHPPPAGQSVAWAWPSIAGVGPQSGTSAAGFSFASANGKSPGVGGLGISRSRPLGQNTWYSEWGGFAIPPEVPMDAEIVAVYGVVKCLASGGTFFGVEMNGGSVVPIVTTGFPETTFYGGASGFPATVHAHVDDSLFQDGVGQVVSVTFVGLAVYYTGTPKTKLTLLNEALNDIWLGAPAKIWFGLLRNGALLGVPYLIFAGTVDKPSVHIGLDTLSVTLALENRLVNLQRANQRRYTAADQKLYYPTDMAFNWVESLNDIALRWGS